MPLPANLAFGLRPIATISKTAACVRVTASVPIEPVNPDSHWRACQCSGRYSDRWGVGTGNQAGSRPKSVRAAWARSIRWAYTFGEAVIAVPLWE